MADELGSTIKGFIFLSRYYFSEIITYNNLGESIILAGVEAEIYLKRGKIIRLKFGLTLMIENGIIARANISGIATQINNKKLFLQLGNKGIILSSHS